MNIANPHAIILEDLIKEYSSDTTSGLSQDDATQRISTYGENTLPIHKNDSWFMIFISQFNNILVYILMVISIVSFVFGKYVDGTVIIVVLAINAVVGAIQEIKAQRDINALNTMVVQTAKVKRNNEIITIDSKDIVPGDIIINASCF